MTDRGWRPARRPRSRSGYLLLALSCALLTACTPPGLPAPIPPAASSPGLTAAAAEPSITIGVDGAVHGFNPHAIADYSPADAAVAQLVLPSVSSVAADGSTRLNPDLVRKAEVTGTAPFTVTYTLDRNASWSDGTPITAEDFSYLRDQMLLQPGTVDPAGYRLITSIVSRDAGKTVVVSFSQSVADWPTLFSPLLPSHILKDSPGGWTEGLATAIPVSGNRYKMLAYDSVTGEISLVRNDKYWGTQPGPSTAVIRIGTPAALIAALHRGDLQAVLLQPDAADQQSLDAQVPVAQRVSVPLPGTVQLVFDTTTGATSDPSVRLAVARALDLTAVRAALDGGNPTGSTEAVSLTSLSGGGTAPPADRTAALAALEAAGYHREVLYMSRSGQVLRLTLGYPSGDARMAAAAQSIQAQLAAVGIEVDLVRDETRALVNGRMAAGLGDLGLVFVPRGSSDPLSAASAFGCPPTPTGSGGSGRSDLLPRAGNLSGFCTTGIQQLLDGWAAGGQAGSLAADLGAGLPVVQIGRPSAVFATSAALTAIVAGSGPGWAFASPLASLPSWPAH